jgi:acetyl esterase
MIARRRLLQTGAALAGAALAPREILAQPAPDAGGKAVFSFLVKDVVYQRQGGTTRLARIYQPAGSGPFPAVLKVHGGAWNDKDRTDGQNTAMELVNSGVLVVSIDFRNAPEAPYPAALQDINYGIRWLKHHAAGYGSSADRVGLYGTSSGGHLALLAALRPDDPRYRALPFAEAADLDARVAFVVSGWGVLFPEARIEISQRTSNHDMLKKVDTFLPSRDLVADATPALVIERGETVAAPPALVFQGTADEWTTPELAQRFAADYRKAGGQIDLEIYEGEHHTFLEDHPNTPNSKKALAAIKSFVKKYGMAQQALR